jgi:hypothetical protein
MVGDQPKLLDPTTAAERLGALGELDTGLLLQVCEARCFDNHWLTLGSIRLFPREPASSAVQQERLRVCVLRGQYVWEVPSEPALSDALEEMLPSAGQAKSRPKDVKAPDPGSSPSAPEMSPARHWALQPVSEAIQDVARRTGLLSPTFDPGISGDLPFQLPTTLVADTSAVLQGALSFAARYLCPMARIKIPKVVALEIGNMADRFLAMHRSANQKTARCLQEHTKSQGAQRVLLGLEWRSLAEVERPASGDDPLRMVFMPDTEAGFRDLNLSQIQRSFADRLVLESAQQHQAHLSRNHRICVLTSDQGLARTALAEGISPLYFEARKTSRPLGRTLPGTHFHPFNGQLVSVPLPEILWELATCFGQARLVTGDGSAWFQAQAMGDLVWYPYQASDDLLWCSWSGLDQQSLVRVSVETKAPPDAPAGLQEIGSSGPHSASTGPSSTSHVPAPPVVENGEPARPRKSVPAYVISPQTLFTLVQALVEQGPLTIGACQELLKVGSPETVKEYRHFLLSGGLVQAAATGVHMAPTERLRQFWEALTTANRAAVRESLCHIPSFADFLLQIDQHGRSPEWQKEMRFRKGIVRGYRALGELCGSVLAISGRGICATPATPTAEEFRRQAIGAYRELARSDPWVLTGAWLEELAWAGGIHPITVHGLLREATALRLLRFYLEGSTPERGYPRHTVSVFSLENQAPVVRSVPLYDGTFLVPGRPSVRIKLEDGTNEP